MSIEIGTQFIRYYGKRKDVETVVDILKTYNSKNELVKIEYVVEHDLLGQKVKDIVSKTTIMRSITRKAGKRWDLKKDKM